jgi:hypothetical protein
MTARPGTGGAVAGAAEARALLASGTAREVLARIVPGDPLALRGRIAARLAREALLCDAEHALLSAQALCAWHAAGGLAAPSVTAWLDERVEAALAGVLAEPEPGASLATFALPLGLDPGPLAGALARFARLPPGERHAFVALVLDGGDADRVARARGLSLTELARRARAALEVFRRSPA